MKSLHNRRLALRGIPYEDPSGPSTSGFALSIPVKVSAATPAGIAITASVLVSPQGKAARPSADDECTVTMWRQDFLHWSIVAGPEPTRGGQVAWGEYNYKDAVYRLTAKHTASGAEVDHIYTLKSNLITSEEAQHTMNEGISMPEDFV